MEQINIPFTVSKGFNKFYSEMQEECPEFLEVDGIGSQLDFRKFRKAFFQTGVAADVSVDANANVDSNDVVSFGFECVKPMFRLDNYATMYDMIVEEDGETRAEDILRGNIYGRYYINDFSGDLAKPYCFNYSCIDIHYEGLSTVTKIISVAPKHILAFFKQLEQFIGIASNNTHGATGVADLLIVLSYYVDKAIKNEGDSGVKFASEEDVWKYVREQLTSFVYTVNQPLFRANQSPFTNVSIYDDAFLKSLSEDYYFSDNTNPKIETVKRLQEIFMDIKNEEMSRTPVTFPVVTACFTKDENDEIADKDFMMKVAEESCKYGAFEIYIGETSTLSSCCRLRSSTDNQFFNSFGAGSSKIGSMGVVTVNLPRHAYAIKAFDDKWERFLNFVSKTQDDVSLINHCKRNFIKKHIDMGGLPLYTNGFMSLNKQYSTVGINGINEALEILGYDILTEEGQGKVKELMAIINKKCTEHEELYGFPHNCEQVPGENSSIKLAKKDRMMGLNTKYSFYSNQFIPLIKDADILDRIRLQGMFDNDFSGGSICHLNFGSQPNVEEMMFLMEACCKAGVIYFAPVLEYNFCKNKHTSIGPNTTCPVCGENVDKYMKVVGFLTKVDNWHEKRRTEDFPNRKRY